MKLGSSEDEYIRRERRDYPSRTVAVLIFVDATERILLVKTNRLPNHWQPLGGGVKPSDISPKAAAIREIKEEVGITLKASQLRRIYKTSYDFGTGAVHFFACYFTSGTVLRVNTAEILSWEWFSLENAMTLPVFPATGKVLSFLNTHQNILTAVARGSDA